MREDRLLLSVLLHASLVLCPGMGPASADEAPPRKETPDTARRPGPAVSIREYNGFRAVHLGGSVPSYLIDRRTETCAMVGPGGSLLAVDCAKLATNLPQVRDVITWLAGAQQSAPPPAPPVTDQELDKGIRCKEGQCTLDRGLFDRLLSDNNQLTTSARFVPSMKDGTAHGFKIYAVRPGSVFARLGLNNGDLVKTVNGLDISTPDRALEAYTRLRTTSELILGLERRGESVTLSVQIR